MGINVSPGLTSYTAPMGNFEFDLEAISQTIVKYLYTVYTVEINISMDVSAHLVHTIV